MKHNFFVKNRWIINKQVTAVYHLVINFNKSTYIKQPYGFFNEIKIIQIIMLEGQS